MKLLLRRKFFTLLPPFSIVVGVLVALAFELNATLVVTDGTTTSTTNRFHQPQVDPELVTQMAEVEKLPTIEADTVPRHSAVAYYSAQNLLWPPLPSNFHEFPMWDLGDGHYLLNDLNWDYSTPATTATALALTSSLMALDSGGGVVTMSDLIQSGVPYLTIVPTNANQVLITVINDIVNFTNPVSYELWTTPVLANPTWTMLTNGAVGQTNFTVAINVNPTGFFRAIWDTNAVPIWAAADSSNPGAGYLTVFIDSPTNGATIQ